MKVSFTLNDVPYLIDIDPNARLLDVLRDDLGLVGTKEACGEGKCGSCTVLVDNMIQLACLIPAIRIEGKHIKTIEGLSEGDTPNYVQKAFIDADAVQCGFCTPGLIVAIYDYIERGGENSRVAIKKALAGNLCRCTGYVKIIDAVQLAFKYKFESEDESDGN